MNVREMIIQTGSRAFEVDRELDITWTRESSTFKLPVTEIREAKMGRGYLVVIPR